MDKLYQFIEKILMRPMVALSGQRHLQAVRDGMISTIPLTIVGSFFLIIAFPPVPEHWKTSLALFRWISNNPSVILMPFRMSMGLIALYATYNIGYHLAKSYQLDAASGGTLSLLAFFLTMTAPQAFDQGGESLGFVLLMSKLGGAGLFVGIITAILAVELLHFLKTRGIIIKMPEGVPESVSRAFEALLPTLILMLFLWSVTMLLKFDIHQAVNNLFKPLSLIVNTPLGAVIIVLLITLLWSAGIHGVSVIGVMARPVWLEMLSANADALEQGSSYILPYIAVEPFYQWFIWIGGSGGTLGLALCLLLTRSSYLKELGKVSLIPSLFNINEPLIFGLPIMLNPFFTIPFILGPVLATILTYTLMLLNWVSRPFILVPWTFPAPIGAFFTTGGDARAVLLVIVNILLMSFIYYPFLKAYDQKLLKEELLSKEKGENV